MAHPKTFLQRTRRARIGANALEFALTLPAFVLLMATLFDFGWLFYQQAMLDTAIHEGCRDGAVIDPEEAVPEDVASDTIFNRLNQLGQGCPSDSPVSSREAEGSGDDDDDSGGFVSVLGDDQDCAVLLDRVGDRPAISMQCEVQRRYVPLFGIVPSPDVIAASTRMRFEWQDQVDGGT